MSVHLDDPALTGGRWVNVRGVQRWVPDPPVLRLVPDLERVACACGAKVTETCRTRRGHRTKTHDYRQIPRACRCGTPLGWKRRLCDDCYEQNGREQRAAYRRRLQEAS